MKLKLYNESNNQILIKINKKKKLGQGLYGTVFLVDSFAFKKLEMPLTKAEKIAFEIIKDITHSNLYKIKELFYSDANNLENLVAYFMRYYSNDNVNILTMPMDYTLDNFSDLNKLALLLANNHIDMKDLHYGNAIKQNNRIILIDRDKDCYSSKEPQQIFYNNQNKIIYLFVYLYLEQFKEMNKDNKSIYYDYRDIIYSLNDCNYDGFIKELSPYTRPIDYINQKIKRI